MTPAVGASRLAIGCLLGMVLGMWYGFLRPLRRTVIRDLLFAAGAFYLWLYYSFAVCRGDLRLGMLAAMGMGAAVWEASAGRALQPVFELIWKNLSKLAGAAVFPMKTFLFFLEKMFASVKKSVTINQMNYKRPGGKSHVRRQKHPDRQRGPAPGQSGTENSSDRADSVHCQSLDWKYDSLPVFQST